MAEYSPMMKQYFKIKEENKDSILFFRLGDFYEMFFEDAKIASRELELTLTGRECGQEQRAPMCGIPHHSSETYIARLVSKGFKVAICEQVSDPSASKGIVERDVVRVITPGTVMESSMLEESKNNFICSIFSSENKIGLAFCDVSTGQLDATTLLDKDIYLKLKNELARFKPREILLNSQTLSFKKLSDFIKDKMSANVELFEDDKYKIEDCREKIISQFSKQKAQEFETQNEIELLYALGGLLSYLKQTQKKGLERISNIEVYSWEQYMNLDFSTVRNLELLETMRNKDRKGSLLWVLDKSKTAMGKRLIRLWIEQPLVSCAKIIDRQNALEELLSNTVQRLEIINYLTGIYDIERILTRIVYGNCNARDLRNFAQAIENLPQIKELTSVFAQSMLSQITNNIDTLKDIYDIINNAIVEKPPISIKDGEMIKEGYNEELDILRGDMTNSGEILAKIEAEQRKITGIPKLKISYNRVFGYYIEVSNSYKNMVPSEYIRKQTLTNCERFITQELKDIEGRILGAKEKSFALEFKLYEEVREQIAINMKRVQITAKAIATLDVLCSLATVSAENRYVKPIINLNGFIDIKEGRHPVVQELLDIPFVPNDTMLDLNENKAAIITGPNMAGKSTYMRQVALITLMAQIGCYVPAKSAKIGIVSSIFTRVGASDDLASGQSTFMVEMSEVANILSNANKNSLIIFDEIGRGTSTYDGMSIARAVLEYVVDKKRLGAKTLFATHYHELTELENLLDGVKNYNIAVKKRGDDITFLRRIVRGGADESYGIEVAKLAGVPLSVIKRAKCILKEMYELEGNSKSVYVECEKQVEVQEEFSLFDFSNNAISDKLKSIDINTLTPIESMNVLSELIKMANKN